jgi:hypothetical protein
MKIMWKNIVEWGRPQVTIWRMRTACWTTNVTHSLTVCQTYCFSTATVASRTRFNVRSHVLYLTCLIFIYFNRNITTATKCDDCSSQLHHKVICYGPHSVSSATASCCAHSVMRSRSLGKDYADGRVHFIYKVIFWLAACKDEIYRRKFYFCVTVAKLQYKGVWTAATVQWYYRAVSVTEFCGTETQFKCSEGH